MMQLCQETAEFSNIAMTSRKNTWSLSCESQLMAFCLAQSEPPTSPRTGEFFDPCRLWEPDA